ncbi:hypothetical protein AB0H88_29855 [Nonomuraea sp. NPDC050680]|uniref:hypothetical protein n=1 Tax=Nonomuraea sp. NPDC050680 TaxID=3154630 RepID=UPI00340791B1
MTMAATTPIAIVLATVGGLVLGLLAALGGVALLAGWLADLAAPEVPRPVTPESRLPV